MRRITNDTIMKELRDAENEKKAMERKLQLNKKSFISDMNGYLGDKIKKDPMGIKIVKPPLRVRIARLLKKFFTKF